MNHIYRLIWNFACQAWTAVPETAAGRGRPGRCGSPARRGARAAVLALALAGASLAPAQTVTLAPGQQGRAYVSANGTTVVDIASANGAGVSHNRFTRYDVGRNGLVLNNTTAAGAVATGSRLAGSVLANLHSARAASLILNEVVSNSRSVLAGFTEVAGQRADVVVANPWGITCSGCGFVNTDRVTLTTGTPLWNGGALAGFEVDRGSILVRGDGLNGEAQKTLDLVTRSLRLDGAVNARQLGVFAGTGSWDYGDRTVATGGGTGAAPAYAIDAGELGAMYANQIRLVANEAGVGVRLLGDAAAQVGDVRISAAGRVELRGQVSARKTLEVASGGELALRGAVLGAGQALSLSAAKVAIAGGSHVESQGRLQAVSDGALVVGNSGMKAAGDLALVAGGKLAVATGEGQGLQSTAGAVHLQAAAALEVAGSVSADVGELRLRAGSSLATSGTMHAGGALQARAAGRLDNTGELLAQGALDVQAGELLANGGVVQGGTVALQAGALHNTGTLMATTGATSVDVTGALTNTGLVQAQTALAVQTGAAATLRNSGRLVAGSAAGLATGTLANEAGGVLVARGGAMEVDAAQGVDNAGTVQGRTLALDAASLANGGKLLATHGAATLATAGVLANAGTVQAATRLQASAQALDNGGKLLARDGDLVLDVTALLANGADASVASAGALLLRAGEVDNAGLLAAVGRVDAQAGRIANSGTLQAVDALVLQAGGTLDNQGRILAGGTGQVTSGELVNGADAELRAALDLAVHAGAGGVRNSGLLKSGLGSGSPATLALESQGAVANEAGAQVEAGRLQLAAASLANRGSITAGSGGTTLDLAAGLVNASGATLSLGSAGSSSEVVAASVDNQGTLQSQGDLDFVLGGRFDNGSSGDATARVLAGGDLTFRGRYTAPAYGVVNHGIIDAQGALRLGGVAPRQPGDPIVIGGATPCTTDYCGSGRAASLRLYGSMQGGTVDVATELLSLGARGELLSRGDMDITTDRLQMAQAPDPQDAGQVLTGRILGGMAGSGTVQVSSLASLDVTGLIHSRGDLRVSAPDIEIGVNGALSALNDLDLRATRGTLDLSTPMDPDATHAGPGVSNVPGKLTNLGTLYAGRTLSARVNGTLTNAVLIERANGTPTLVAQGTIAAGQDVDLLANTLVNNSDIHSDGDLRIVATSLRNEVQGGDRRVYTQTFDPNWANDDPDAPQMGWNVVAAWDDGGLSSGAGNTYTDYAQNLEKYYTETLSFREDEMPLHWPTLTAAREAKLYFNNGKNLGGLIQGVDAVLMQGFAARDGGTALIEGLQDDAGRVIVAPGPGAADMAVFTNDSLAQVTVSKAFRMTRTWKDDGSGEEWHWCRLGTSGDGTDGVCTQDGRGSKVPVHIVRQVTPQLPVGYSGARIYTAHLSGGNFTLYNEGSSGRATYERGDPTLAPSTTMPDGTRGAGRDLGAATSTTLLAVSAPGTPVPGPAQSSVLPGDGTQTGWTPVSLEIVPTTADGTGLQAAVPTEPLRGRTPPLHTGLSFGGVHVKLPTSANGLFVTTRDPGARYLVESNPLYRTGSPAAGSGYLEELLGFSADQALLRLGDGSYEAWLVQQQLLAQTGNMLLKGYTSLDALMRGLMDNAAGQAKDLGLAWGQALTAAQVAGLKSDLVWMVRTTLNGREVLVPVVYLGQATKDSIRKGAVIEAGSGSLTVSGQANSGTVSGVTVTNVGGGKGPASLFDFGSGGASAQNFNDQSFEIVKSYLLSTGGGSVGIADVTGWLEKNGANHEALGKVLPFAYQRYMALATGGGQLSANDKAFVAYVGEYAKQQRLAAIDKSMADWEAYKKDNSASGRGGTLTGLLSLPPAPPQWLIDQAKQGVILNDKEKQLVGTMFLSSGIDPTAIGSGAIAASAAAGGAAAGAAVLAGQAGAGAVLVGGNVVTTGIAPFTAVSSSALATGPIAIVAATLAVAGQALANVIRAEMFEDDLREQRARIANASGSDVAAWLNEKGGAEQLFLSMAKMMAN